MLRIGLTGGIGAGKSTAAARFGELGARVIDHDILARRVVEPGSAALADIVGEFGDRVVKGGLLDRASLAAIVFADDHARVRLEEIIHPYVRAAASAADRQARGEGVGVVVHDIPLLVETGQGGDFDLVVCVTAPLSTRIARLQQARGLTREQAMGRALAQASDEERAAVCDVELDGSGTVEQVRAQVDQFWSTHLP
ncbi:dephospho-CoA kinase [Demequina sp.]|uniref:dephospho-CoA kinase n=1 Tax=Demequina sp. TaxID=2050685 RepID=UPI0025B9DF1E|nr:dephospho-CoA kinase [Demequina sp.]